MRYDHGGNVKGFISKLRVQNEVPNCQYVQSCFEEGGNIAFRSKKIVSEGIPFIEEGQAGYLCCREEREGEDGNNNPQNMNCIITLIGLSGVLEPTRRRAVESRKYCRVYRYSQYGVSEEQTTNREVGQNVFQFGLLKGLAVLNRPAFLETLLQWCRPTRYFYVAVISQHHVDRHVAENGNQDAEISNPPVLLQDQLDVQIADQMRKTIEYDAFFVINLQVWIDNEIQGLKELNQIQQVNDQVGYQQYLLVVECEKLKDHLFKVKQVLVKIYLIIFLFI